MKFGDMKYDIPFESFNKNKLKFSKFEKWKIKNEGKRLYKKHSEYSYLKEDPWLTDEKEFDEDEFYESVVYAYIKNYILKQNPKLNDEYKRIVQKHIDGWHKEGKGPVYDQADKAYSWFNYNFLVWYSNYLREQADPGILERERKKREQEQKNLQIAHDMQKMQAKIQEQQDLASGKRVVCPYCKSTNTEKISTVNRAVSVSLVGAASGKIGKQWHCKQCGSNF